LIIAEEGTPNASKGGWATSNSEVYNYFRKKLTNSKECLNGTHCWYAGKIKDLNGDTWEENGLDNNSYPKLILSDGTLIFFRSISTDCSQTDHNMDDICIWIWVDVNGVKKPNTWGRDLFQFYVTEKHSVKPRGCSNIYDLCANQGHSCACKVIKENAMNY